MTYPDAISSTDLLAFPGLPEDRKKAIAQKVGRALFDKCLIVTITPEEEKIFEHGYAAMPGFFDLPLETKQDYKFNEYRVDRPMAYKGYIDDNPNNPGLREYFVTVSGSDGQKEPAVPEAENFNNTQNDVYDFCSHLSDNLLSALSVFWGLDEGHLKKMMGQYSKNYLRSIKYPAQGHVDTHEDRSLISLVHSTTPGLRIPSKSFDHDGAGNEVIVLNGNILFDLTDQLFYYTDHSVHTDQDRLSYAFFSTIRPEFFDNKRKFEEQRQLLGKAARTAYAATV